MLIAGDSMTVYLDQVWLLNSLVDYLLLSVSGHTDVQEGTDMDNENRRHL